MKGPTPGVAEGVLPGMAPDLLHVVEDRPQKADGHVAGRLPLDLPLTVHDPHPGDPVRNRDRGRRVEAIQGTVEVVGAVMGDEIPDLRQRPGLEDGLLGLDIELHGPPEGQGLLPVLKRGP